jgi:hypothetical protein
MTPTLKPEIEQKILAGVDALFISNWCGVEAAGS